MKKLFSLLGAAITWLRFRGPTSKGYSPYAARDCNMVYNMLFCDKVDVFRKDRGAKPEGVWATLLANVPYAAALHAIADDPSHESRIRALAYTRLRELNEPVPKKQLLGVIVELGMDEGLDVLAAYPDGGVRYINHKNSISVYEPVPPAWQPKLRRLFAAAQKAVEQTGPWQHPRTAPPMTGMIRMSFLVSDGLYFGQGLTAIMEHDAIAQPIIAASVDLLKSVAQDSKA
jgi:hypothetical protein